MPIPSASLSTDQLEDLQTFLKDWLRHTGRTQADLRRALRAHSIRMPVLIEELHRIHQQQGLVALAERLCGIEALWQGEDTGLPESEEERDSLLEVSLGQLDLLLEEIRLESGSGAIPPQAGSQ
jgi:hypothetical protein